MVGSNIGMVKQVTIGLVRFSNAEPVLKVFAHPQK
jgi:hypothetical protein